MYYRPHRFLYMVATMLTLIVLNVLFITLYFFFGKRTVNAYASFYGTSWLLLNIWWVVFIVTNRVYIKRVSVSYDFFLKNRIKINVTFVFFAIVYLFFFSDLQWLRFLTVSTLLCYCITLVINRFFYSYFGNGAHSGRAEIKKVLILGYNNVAHKLVKYLEDEQVTYNIVGFAEDNENIMELSNYPIVSDIKHTIEVSKRLKVNEIFLTISPEKNNELYNLIYEAESECIRVLIVPDLSHFIDKPVHVQYFRDIPILLLRTEPLENIVNKFVKRFFDVSVSIVAILLILWWLIPVLGLLIFIESRGPVFFAQMRTGRNNKQFACLKFRSMRVNNEADSKQATRGDSRITRIGKIIRKTNIDEFPQFINVLKGEMSLVGPRPHMLKHTQDYSQVVNQFMIRQFLKPGITGWAQVNGFRGEINNKEQLEKRLEFDIWYLENWSFFLDVKIIFLTIFNALKGEKNAF